MGARLDYASLMAKHMVGQPLAGCGNRSNPGRPSELGGSQILR